MSKQTLKYGTVIGLCLGVRTCETHQWRKNKENKEVNTIDPNPNNSYKTKKKFTGSYTEGNPVIAGAQLQAGTGFKMQTVSVVFSTLHC